MLALFYFLQDKKLSPQKSEHANKTYHDFMKLWIKHYIWSETTVPFTIFTDKWSYDQGCKNIDGVDFKVIELPDNVPAVNRSRLAYTDLLRSYLYDNLDQPCLYTDHDILMLESFDPLWEQFLESDKEIGMAKNTSNIEGLNAMMSCGLIGFKKSYSNQYVELFQNGMVDLINTRVANNQDAGIKLYIYGQLVWDKLFIQEKGMEFPSVWNLKSELATPDTKGLHFLGPQKITRYKQCMVYAAKMATNESFKSFVKSNLKQS